jgi:hypothetical protein
VTANTAVLTTTSVRPIATVATRACRFVDGADAAE